MAEQGSPSLFFDLRPLPARWQFLLATLNENCFLYATVVAEPIPKMGDIELYRLSLSTESVQPQKVRDIRWSLYTGRPSKPSKLKKDRYFVLSIIFSSKLTHLFTRYFRMLLPIFRAEKLTTSILKVIFSILNTGQGCSFFPGVKQVLKEGASAYILLAIFLLRHKSP